MAVARLIGVQARAEKQEESNVFFYRELLLEVLLVVGSLIKFGTVVKHGIRSLLSFSSNIFLSSSLM